MDPLMFSGEPGGPIVMRAHVSPAPGHGLLFHSPAHASTHTHTVFFILSGYIILTHTCTQDWNLRPSPLSICRGYLHDASSHPRLWLVSSRHTHLGFSTRPPWLCVLGDQAVINGILWPLGHGHIDTVTEMRRMMPRSFFSPYKRLLYYLYWA